MPIYYFPKPQPLSPKTKTWLEGDVRYRTLKGKKVAVSGVATTDSIYYLWFDYLKRSEKYKKACKESFIWSLKELQQHIQDLDNI